MKKKPFGLVAIVIYKSLTALLLALTSIALFVTFKNYQDLENFSEPYQLEGKKMIIEWLLHKILKFSPGTLKFGGIAAGFYAVVTIVEAIGLWHEKKWAELMVIGLVGLSIPFELFELSRRITILKIIILLINGMVLWYLLRHFSRSKTGRYK